jgi:hypothetical protein
MKYLLCISVTLLLLLAIHQPLLAQEEEKGNVFAISTYKVPFNKIDHVLSMWEKHWKPVYSQNEHIKSLRVMRHLWGSDWTLVVIMEYESMGAMEDAQKRGNELRKEKYPDEDEWKAIMDELQGYIMGHFDDLVQEIPKLRK